MSEFHFIRPLWLFAFIPCMGIFWRLLLQKPVLDTWLKACDAHLLPFLVQQHGRSKRLFSLMMLFTSLLFMILSLAGPTWSRLPVPIYLRMEPHVVVLDMSSAMLLKDLSPSRLDRAKFVLHDLFQGQNNGLFAMVAYTSEPFVVSPLTQDAETIDALLSSLTPNVMPIQGHQLDKALLESARLLEQAGFQHGSILVLTAHVPTTAAMEMAKILTKKGMDVSVLPMTTEQSSLFQSFANNGHGQVIPLTDAGVHQWLNINHTEHRVDSNPTNEISVWRDRGRWFLIPALICLLPVFRRGWLQRMSS